MKGSLSQNLPPWYNTNWHYRAAVTISNSGSALTNYQVLVTLSASFGFAHAQPDGRDLRVTGSDGVTGLDFWIESWDSTNQAAYVWVEVPTVPAGSSTIYLYYGNATAAAAGSGSATFNFFDDTWCQYPGASGCGPTNPVHTATQSWWETYVTYPMVFEDTSFAGRPRYHMLYDGHGVIGHAKGYAYSADLNTWTEYNMGTPHPPNPNPIMGTGYAGGSPYAWGDAVKVGSTYYLFASSGPGTTQRIESTNLITWTNFTTLSENDPGGNIGTGAAILKQPNGITPVVVAGKYWMVYYHGDSPGTMYLASSPVTGTLQSWTYVSSLLTPSASGFDANGLWTPSFIRFGDMYYIYYQGQSSSGLWETGYARASAYSGGLPIPPDPVSTSWSKSDTNGDGIPDSVLKVGGSGSWDSGYVIDPMVRQFSDGVYYLFYTGNQNNGYATASAPDGPWTKLGSDVSPLWTTRAGSPTVSGGVLTLNPVAGITSNTTFQYQAVGYRANFGVGSGLLWGGFINGAQNDRAMIGSVTGQPAQLYLKNYVTAEATALLCNGTCRGAMHTYEVMWRNGNSLARMDHGVSSATLSTQVPTMVLPVTFYSYTSAGAALMVDWVYVRQYRNPEPVSTLGVEQGLVDLEITKVGEPDPVYAGEPLTYTLSVTNSSSEVASGVVVTDVLPVGAHLVSVETGQGTCVEGAEVVCALGSISGTEEVEITLVITSVVDGALTNTAEVASSDYELVPGDNRATEVTMVLGSADLGVSQTSKPESVRAGEEFTYTLRVQNAGPSDSGSVTLTDTLPGKVVFMSVEPGVYCPQASPVVCSLPGIAAKGESQVQVVVRSTQDGVITNTVTAISATYDPDLLNNTSEYVSVVATGADLSVGQVDRPDPLYAGDVLTYTITVHNPGPSIAVNVRLTDTLPAGVTLVSVTPDRGSCDSGSVVTCDLDNLQMDEDATVIVAVLTSLDGIIYNTVRVASDTEDLNPFNNQNIAATTVMPVADLWVSQVDQPDPVHANALVTYTLTVHNAGPSSSADMTLTDTLPVDVNLVLASPRFFCTQASPVVCNLPGLPASGSSQVQVVVQTTVEGLLTNTVTVASATYDRNLVNNTSLENTVVATTADLSITQVDNPDPVLAEQELTYTLSVHNAGPSIAAAVELTDTLPGNVSIVSVTPDKGNCSSGDVITCDLGYLLSGASVDVEVVVIPQAEGSIANLVEVSTKTFDDYLANNTDTEATEVLPLSADLELTLADSPHLVMAGGLLTYTAQVANLGPSRAISTSVSFNLSSEVTFVTSTPACSETGGLVTCPLGEIAANGSATVNVIVQVSSSTFVTQITSLADVTSMVADPESGNNHASVTTIVDREADLEIQIFDTPDPVAPGTNLTYTLVYTNHGPSDAVEPVLTDNLSQEVDFNHASPNICKTSPGHKVICKPVYDLAAGHSDQISLVVTVKAGVTQPFSNAVSITSQTRDPNSGNDNASAITSIDDTPPTLIWVAPVPTDMDYMIVAYPGQAITLTVIASDKNGIARVEFYYWNVSRNGWEEIGVDYMGESNVYECVWVLDIGMLKFPNLDQSQIYAFAYDTAGNLQGERIFFVPHYVLLPLIMK